MYQKEAKISLYTFAIASITFLIAKILDMELLELLVKPIIIPSIFFYYLLTKKVNLNFLNSKNLIISCDPVLCKYLKRLFSFLLNINLFVMTTEKFQNLSTNI